MRPPNLRTAQSRACDAEAAVREFRAAVAQPAMGLVIFFCSSDYDLDALALCMAREFADTPVVGCTTAGEFGPQGCLEHSLVGVSFATGACVAVSGRVDGLRQFGAGGAQTFVQSLLRTLEGAAPQASAADSFALLLVDGLSRREEPLTRVLQMALGNLPVVGGSAGDGLNFRTTHVYHDGRFHTDSAVLTLVHTTLPFEIFKTQHFVATDERLVITRAQQDSRVVREINGLPAAQEYARLVGVALGDLNPLRFAASPVVVLIDGQEYVRSIQKVNPDGSLTFFCAIEEGLVLRVTRGVDLVDNLAQTFARLQARLGALHLVLGCDCILRRLEIQQAGTQAQVEALFRAHNAVGFNTYGEQYRGIHVNQTLTGIAFGGAHG